ncbi:hypothetical protein QUC32_23170 [Novosphingobium resinovorum]|uniref:hypothetical protein n=1 Tax=Novosphingobium TaxID=165696 RepID=UPI001B3C7796|nr:MULTISPECIES: hypothetical protein [Novosphingobium]MBF7012553.1 hypothetical protein [Novosphingobium sp. HR1a]WJM27286.1 hypothetical protein QUC32_23170 [Novosphingobium resinovorum]
MRRQSVELTADTIQRTRAHFAEICRGCIQEAQEGKVYVNDLAHYIRWQTDSEAEFLAGRWDHTFTFLQRAHWLQTGECVALLS